MLTSQRDCSGDDSVQGWVWVPSPYPCHRTNCHACRVSQPWRTSCALSCSSLAPHGTWAACSPTTNSWTLFGYRVSFSQLSLHRSSDPVSRKILQFHRTWPQVGSSSLLAFIGGLWGRAWLPSFGGPCQTSGPSLEPSFPRPSPLGKLAWRNAWWPCQPDWLHRWSRYRRFWYTCA